MDKDTTHYTHTYNLISRDRALECTSTNGAKRVRSEQTVIGSMPLPVSRRKGCETGYNHLQRSNRVCGHLRPLVESEARFERGVTKLSRRFRFF